MADLTPDEMLSIIYALNMWSAISPCAADVFVALNNAIRAAKPDVFNIVYAARMLRAGKPCVVCFSLTRGGASHA
jgi:hypothetical protein